MPLEPKDAPLPFTFGIDNNDDEEGASKGFNALTNSVFDKDGAVVGRGGFVTTTDLDPILNATSIGKNVPKTFVRSGDALSVATEDDLYLAARAVATIYPGQRIQQVDAASDTSNTYTAFVITALTEDSTTVISAASVVVTTLYWVVVENATGAVVQVAKLTTQDGSYLPRVVALDSGVSTTQLWAVYFLKKNGANFDLAYLRVTGSRPPYSITASPTVIQASVAHTGVFNPYDVTVDAAHTFSFAVWTAGGSTVAEKRNTSGTQTATVSNAGWGGIDLFLVRTTVAATDHVLLLYFSGNTLKCNIGNFATGFISSTVTLDPTTLVTGQIAAAEESAGNVVCAYNKSTNLLCTATVAVNTGTPVQSGTNDTVSSNAVIASKAQLIVGNHDMPGFPGSPTNYVAVAVADLFANNTGYKNIVVLGLTTTNIQAPRVIGQLTHEDGAPLNPTALSDVSRFAFQLPAWHKNGDTYRVPVLVNEETGSANQATVTTTGLVRRVRLVELTARGDLPAVSTTTLGNQCFIAQSILEAWDGRRFAPAALLYAPSAPTLNGVNAGVLTGTYSYRTVVEYTDIHGNISLSPPSTVNSVTVAAKAVTLGIQLDTLWGTYDARAGRPFRVRIYRTVASGSDYYYAVTVVLDPSTYASGVNTATIDDNTADATLITAAPLYTVSSVISSMAPMAKYVWSHRNRLFAIAADQPETVYYTTETTEPFRPLWNGALFIRVDNSGGPPLAGASLSDKILILQEKQLCVSGGDGPNALGTSGAFSVPERFSAIGVSRDRIGTVVECRGSVFFTNKVSAYIVGPDLSVAPIGQALGGRTFWSAAVFNRARYLPSLDQLWLLGDTATGTYVYDFNLSRWSQFTGAWGSFIDVAERLGSVYALPSVVDASGNYRVVKYTPTANYDTNLATGANAYVTQVIDTPWFRPGANGGDARLWRASLWARHDAASPTTSPGITVATYISDERSSRSSSTPVATFAWAGSIIQGMARSFLLKLRPNTPRCRAFRTVITVTPTATTDDRIVVAGITYSYGITGPSGKQPAAKAPSAS